MLPKTFYQTGNFEFFKINFKKKILSISKNKIGYFKIKGFECNDIDNQNDFEIASKYLKIKKYIKPKIKIY